MFYFRFLVINFQCTCTVVRVPRGHDLCALNLLTTVESPALTLMSISLSSARQAGRDWRGWMRSGIPNPACSESPRG